MSTGVVGREGQRAGRSEEKGRCGRLGAHQGRAWSEDEKQLLLPPLKNSVKPKQRQKVTQQLGLRFSSYFFKGQKLDER